MKPKHEIARQRAAKKAARIEPTNFVQACAALGAVALAHGTLSDDGTTVLEVPSAREPLNGRPLSVSSHGDTIRIVLG